MARTGRRPGNQDTREAILAAAREAFAERGFDRTSIRAIATSAGVDPALVHHYFGTKDELFLATVQAPMDPAVLLPRVLDGDVKELPERLLRTFLSVWDHPVTGPAALALVRSGLQHDWSARMLREFLTSQILRVISEPPSDLAVKRDPNAPPRNLLRAWENAFAATINRTLKSFALAIVGAEYLLGWLPRGTHRWDKLVTPNELEAAMERAGLHSMQMKGVIYDLLADAWKLSDDVDVNYMVAAERRD